MPIYMDRHNVQGATHSVVEEAHRKDLEVQAKYGVRFLTYWFDGQRGAIFCLVDAPTRESLRQVHDEAHGQIPHDIVEVDLSSVETFLGRITDPQPQKSANGEEHLPIDSAFRSILFTDLKDSTSMSTTIGDTAAIALLDRHDTIIREALKGCNGREVKHTGDGMMASFKDVADSVKCAAAIQKGFHDFNSTQPKMPLYVRIGINAGEPVERGNDLFGVTVQLAARICSHAKPAQTLVSGLVYELCKEKLPGGTLTDAGNSVFKGFPYAIQLYEVSWNAATSMPNSGVINSYAIAVPHTPMKRSQADTI